MSSIQKLNIKYSLGRAPNKPSRHSINCPVGDLVFWRQAIRSTAVLAAILHARPTTVTINFFNFITNRTYKII